MIYDAFVERAISILQCVDEDLAKPPRLNYLPNVKDEKDMNLVAKHYMNYQSLVKILATKHKSLIDVLKISANSCYDYDLRIVDKILWIIGDMKSEFRLNSIQCKSVRK